MLKNNVKIRNELLPALNAGRNRAAGRMIPPKPARRDWYHLGKISRISYTPEGHTRIRDEFHIFWRGPWGPWFQLRYGTLRWAFRQVAEESIKILFSHLYTGTKSRPSCVTGSEQEHAVNLPQEYGECVWVKSSWQRCTKAFKWEDYKEKRQNILIASMQRDVINHLYSLSERFPV